MPFGKDRSSFNPMLRNKFIDFCNALHNKDILFTHADFREYTELGYSTNDFVYCDPPYFNSTACYNEAGGWDNQDETDLICFLNYLTSKNIRWALSNNLSTNPTLRNFANRYGYKIHYLNADYSNCNYHKKNKDKTETQEVLITNY
jgi:site-specific DNA-adenine methylase